MSDQFSDLIKVTFRADVNTPPAFTQYDGFTAFLPIAVQVGATTTLMGLPGVFQQGPTNVEFLMTAAGQQVDATAPLWAQQLRADLVTAFAAAHDDRVAIFNLDTSVKALLTQVGQLEQTIGTNVAAIKAKVGA